MGESGSTILLAGQKDGDLVHLPRQLSHRARDPTGVVRQLVAGYRRWGGGFDARQYQFSAVRRILEGLGPLLGDGDLRRGFRFFHNFRLRF